MKKAGNRRMQKRFALVVAVLTVVSVLFSTIICAGLVEAANLIVYNNSAPTQTPYFVVNGTTGFVGIGIPNPVYSFETNGTARIKNLSLGASGYDDTQLLFRRGTDGGVTGQLYQSASITYLDNLQGSGIDFRVVHTSNPIARLAVRTTGIEITGNVSATGNLTINGLSTFRSNISLANNYITNLATPLAAQDAATKAYVDALNASASGNDEWNLSGSNLFPKSLAYNVGIGTTSPQSTFYVRGNTTFEGTVTTGGVNLMRNSDLALGDVYWGSIGGYPEYVGTRKIINSSWTTPVRTRYAWNFTTTSTGPSGDYTFGNIIVNNLKLNSYYTASCYVKTTSTAQGYFGFMRYYENWTERSDEPSVSWGYSNNDTWFRVHGSFNTGDRPAVNIALRGFTTNGSWYVTGCQLEEGKQASTYSPSPLDSVFVTDGSMHPTQYGLTPKIVSTSFTATNAYSIYVPTQNGSFTNRYAFVSEPGAGNVGINITNPIETLNVRGGAIINTSGNSDRGLIIDDTGHSLVFTPSASATGWAFIGSKSNHRLDFGVNNAAFLTIATSNAGVGINTTAPTHALNVKGNSNISGSLFAGVGPSAPAIKLSATGTTPATAAVGLKQTTSSGWAAIFADYEPFAEYGQYYDNSADRFFFTSGASTNNLGSFTVTNEGGSSRTAYIMQEFDLQGGHSFIGGNFGIGVNGSTIPSGSKLHVAGNISLGGWITNLSNPLVSTDAATKAYVDALNASSSGNDEWNLSGSSLFPKSLGYQVGINTTSPLTALTIGNPWSTANGGNNIYISNGGVYAPYFTQDLGILYRTNSSNNTQPDTVGLTLYNNDNGTNGWAPLITFAKRESGASDYKSATAAIGSRAVTGSGTSDAWIDGELWAYTADKLNSGGLKPRLRIGTDGSFSLGEVLSYTDYSSGVDFFVNATSGNVGIGTTSPDQKLHVTGNISLGRRAQSLYTAFIGLTNTDGTFSNSDTVGTTGIIINQSAAGDSDIQFKTGVWGSQESNKVIIKGNGNVGIGTTSPTEKLSVAPNTDVNATIGRAYIGYANTGAWSDNAIFSHYDFASSTGYSLAAMSTGATRINAASGQSISFWLAGNTQAATLSSTGLNVASNITIGGWLTNLSNPLVSTDAATKAYVDALNASSSGNDEWNLSGSNLFPKSLTYNVGLGTTSPQTKLQIVGSDLSTGANLYAVWSPDGNSLQRNWAFNDNSTGWSISTASVQYVPDGPISSYVVRAPASTQVHVAGAHWIPIDQNKTYRVSVWVRSGGAGTPGTNYLSIRTANASFGYPEGNGGWGQPYFYTGAFSTTWVRHEMTIGKNGQYRFDSFERYFQPGVILNYNSEAGYSEFQGFRIEEMPDTLDVIRTTATFNASVLIGTNATTTTPAYNLEIVGASRALNVSSLLYVNSTAVGIGTSNPLDALSLYPSAAIGGITIGAQAPRITFDDINGGQQDGYISYDNGGFGFGNSADRLNIGATGNITIDTNTLFVDADGNKVGIGTTTPSRALDVRGLGNFSGTVYINNGTDIAALVSGADDWNVSGNDLFPLSLGYELGIGTNTPEQALHVKAAYGRLKLESTNAGTSNWSLNPDSSPAGFHINENSATRFTIANGGNVGIGTTTPAAALDVKTTSSGLYAAKFDNNHTDGHGVYIRVNNSDTNRGALVYENELGVQFYLRNDGALGLGGYEYSTMGTGKLQVNGSVGIGTTSPNYRLEINNITSALNVSNMLFANSTQVRIGSSVAGLNGNYALAIGGTGNATLVSGTSGDTAAVLRLVGSSTGTGDIGTIEFQDGSSDYMAKISGYRAGAVDEVGLKFYTKQSGSGPTAVAQFGKSGNLSFLGTQWINGLQNPLVGSDAATKAYVDSLAGGGSTIWNTANGNVYLNTSTNRLGIGNSTPFDILQVAAPEGLEGLGEFGGENLLFNGGAEESTAGWTSTDFGIDTSTGSGGTGTTTPHSGSRYFTGSNDGGWMQTVQLVPNATYTFSARFRPNAVGSTDASSGTLMVRWPAANLTSKNCNPNNYDVHPHANKWTLCSVTFRAPDVTNLTNVSVEVGFRGAGSTHTIAVDDLTLVKGGLVQEYSPISRQIGALEAVSIASRVGIGTNNPAYRLEINNATRGLNVSGFLYVNGSNVGVGTTNPTAGLEVLDDVVKFGDSGTLFLKGYTGDTVSTGIRFQVGSATTRDVAYFAGSGVVGIGTANPSYQLHVNGTTPRLALDRSSGTASSDITFAQAAAEKAIVGIAGTTDALVSGAAAGDLVLRGNSQRILFTTNTGSTIAATITGSNITSAGWITNLSNPLVSTDAATKAYVDALNASASSTEQWNLSSTTLYPKSLGYNVVLGKTGVSNSAKLTVNNSIVVDGEYLGANNTIQIIGALNDQLNIQGRGVSGDSGSFYIFTGDNTDEPLYFGRDNYATAASPDFIDVAITSTGVGINQTSPGADLDVKYRGQYSSIDAPKAFRIYNSDSSAANLVLGVSGNAGILQSRDSTNPFTLALNPYSGKVIVNATTSGAHTFTVSGTANITGNLTSAGNWINNLANPLVSSDAATKAYVDALNASTTSTEQWNISSNNLYLKDHRYNVSLGTVNGFYKLDVNGTARIAQPTLSVHPDGITAERTTANYIANDYETDVSGVGSDAVGESITVSSDYAYFGRNSIKWDYAGSGSANIYNSATGSPSSTNFTVTMYVRYSDGSAVTGLSTYIYIGADSSSVASTITPAGNGWYKVVGTRTVAVAGTLGLTGLTGFDTAKEPVYVDGWQAEVGPVSSPYVYGNRTAGDTVIGGNLQVLGGSNSIFGYGNVSIGSFRPKYRFEINSADKALNVSNFLFANATQIGIGTTNPIVPLHLEGQNTSILVDDTTLDAGDREKALLVLKHTVSGSEAPSNQFDDSYPHAGISFKRDWTTTESTIAKINSYGESGWGGGLAFFTKDDDGSSSSNPTLSLDITPDGNVRVTRGNISLSSQFVTGLANPVVSTDAATKAYVDAATGGAGSTVWTKSGANVFLNTSTDKVGIGMSNPSYKLEVNGTISTTNGSAISYAAGQNYTIWNDDPESSATDDSTDAGYKTMKTFVASKSGSFTMKFSAYIQSGTYYWGFRVLKNNASVAATGCFQSGLDVGEVQSVHAYRRFVKNITDVNAGDVFELQMVSMDGSCVAPVAGNGQILYAKDLRVYSSTPSVESGGLANIWGARVGIGTIWPNYTLEIASTSRSLNVSGLLYVNGTNAGIGTNNPLARLTVVPAASSDTVPGLVVNGSGWGSVGNALVHIDAGTSGDGNLLRLKNYGVRTDVELFEVINNAGTKFLIRGDGAVGINNTNPGSALDINGSIRLSFNNSIGFARDQGSSDYSTFIGSTNYPSQGYTGSDQNYWLHLASKGGTHIVLNTDGGAGAGESAFDDFTVWQGKVDGDRLFEISNTGRVNISNNNLSLTSRWINNLADPKLAQDAATKAYVDALNSSSSSSDEWNISATNVVYLKSLGYNVSIGTVASPDKLTVNGSIGIINGGLWQPAYAAGSSDGLVFHMPFSEATGLTPRDFGPKGYDGVFYGLGANWSTGNTGNAVILNGTSYVEVANQNDFKLNTWNFTVSLWAYLNSTDASGGGNFICKPWNGGGQYNYCISTSGASILGASAASVSYSPSANTWHHLAFTVDSTYLTYYVDGIVVGRTAHGISSWTPSSGDANVNLAIGALYPYGGAGVPDSHGIKGLIDEVKIWKRTLSPEEIRTQYLQSQSQNVEITDIKRFVNTSNSEILRINGANGYVGVGTANPQAKLHVNSSGQAVRLTSLADTSGIYTQFQTSASTGMGYFGVEGSAGGATFTNTLAYATFLSSGASGTALQLGTAGSVKATILGAGNFGINTTAPNYLLEVNSPTRGLNVSNYLFANSTFVGVGIANSAASSAKFQVYGGDAYLWGLNLGYGTSTANIDTDATSKEILFKLGGVERARLNTSGNFGINTTTPQAKLHVQGDAIINASATGGNVIIQL